MLLLQGVDGESEELWGETDALVVVVGKDDVLYSKSTTLQVHEPAADIFLHKYFLRVSAAVAVWL